MYALLITLHIVAVLTISSFSDYWVAEKHPRGSQHPPQEFGPYVHSGYRAHYGLSLELAGRTGRPRWQQRVQSQDHALDPTTAAPWLGGVPNSFHTNECPTAPYSIAPDAQAPCVS